MSTLNVQIDSILIEIWLGNIRTSFIIKYDERWKCDMIEKEKNEKINRCGQRVGKYAIDGLIEDR